MPEQPTRRRGRYRLPDQKKLAGLRTRAGDFPMPSSYPDPLNEFVAVYKETDRLPSTEFAKLNAKPSGGFRMFPHKCRRALKYASGDEKLLFYALWDQHESRYGRANGLLVGTIDWLSKQTGIGSRNSIADAILGLEVRGIVRVLRGRGGRGVSHPNLFLLTCFPDCLGNPPTADYEKFGLPEDRATANDPETQALEEEAIAARFKKRIEARIEIVRYNRNGGLRTNC